MLQRVVSSPGFALATLLMVIFSGLLWAFQPRFGVLPILAIALILPAIRLLAGFAPFKKTRFDLLVILFLATAWIGYWAAYDKEAAWNKIWFIALSVLLYYALAAQPRQNLEWVCVILFLTGFGLATYFFLTHDFVAFPRKVEFVNRFGRRVMETIPRFGWAPVHPNYVAGIAAMTTPFILYPGKKLIKRRTLFSSLALLGMAAGVVVVSFAILMATSRGVLMAIACAFGSWIFWRVISLNGIRFRVRHEALFPPLVLAFLVAAILFLYLGPANAGSVVSEDQPYGTGSRGELAARSLYLLSDFPFTGGGLGAFPGLYSHYILGIPNFYIPNSHNLFLDIAIEQGLLGGLSILVILLGCILFAAMAVVNNDSPEARFFGWLTLFTLIIAFVHGMVDDYLYNGPGTLLLLSLAGLSTILRPDRVPVTTSINRRVPAHMSLLLIGFLMINLNGIRSMWHANIGAVRMAKVELAGFPTGQWADSAILPGLKEAERSFQSALQADPTNRTANHRLGLIALLRQDFHSARDYLEEALREAPNHRGILKALGYCYVWLGESEKALASLQNVPEAATELDIYIWWWGMQGRSDLSDNASLLRPALQGLDLQP